MPEALHPLKALTELEQAIYFHARERRRSLAGIPELFRTHQIFGGTAMAVASIATAVFPTRDTEVTFKTAIRFASNTSTRTGLIFEFGSSTTGVALWIEDQVIGFRAGPSSGTTSTFSNGAQWPAGLELEIVAAIRPGLGALEVWLNGTSVIKVQKGSAFANNEWAASSAGSFAAAAQGTIPSDVVQTGAPSNFAVIEPLSVYIGSRPRQFVLPFVEPEFSVLDLNPVLWLDASDETTISSSANFVNGWTDKSASGLDFAQTAGAAQPRTNINTINSLNVIDFDGTNDFIAASATASFKQVFFVAKANTGTTSLDGIFNQAGSNAENVRVSTTVTLFRGNGNNTEDSTDFTFSSGEMRINGAVSETIALDTAFLLSALNPNTASTFIPSLSQNTSSRFWNGDIAEVLGFSDELSTSDRGNLETYFSEKWGITLA